VNWGGLPCRAGSQLSYRMIDPVFINMDYAGGRRGRSRRIAAGGGAASLLTLYTTPQLLDIAIAQGEAKVQPHGVLDDDRRKTMPAIGDRSHTRSLRRTPPIQQAVFLTVPLGPLKTVRFPICHRGQSELR